jgi:enoyl-CoA hydratase
MDEFVSTVQSVRGGVHTIRFNRPEKLNAMNPAMLKEIRTGLLRASDNPKVHTIVLRGDARAFSVGADMPTLDSVTATQGWYETYDVAPYQLITMIPKTVVSVVSGFCIAGGVVVASASDIVLASSDAVFSISQARVGLADPFNSVLLARAVGTMRASYMTATGDRITAQQAADWGLVNSVVAPEALDQELDRVLTLLNGSSPDARAVYKRIKNQSLPAFDLAVIARSAVTRNGREGLEAYAGRRPADWGPLFWQDSAGSDADTANAVSGTADGIATY